MLFATYPGHVHLWDTALRQMTHCAAVGFTPRCVAFSSTPVGASYHIAVGGVKGQIKVSLLVVTLRGPGGRLPGLFCQPALSDW